MLTCIYRDMLPAVIVSPRDKAVYIHTFNRRRKGQ